jgi:hypothetical protein
MIWRSIPSSFFNMMKSQISDARLKRKIVFLASNVWLHGAAKALPYEKRRQKGDGQ